MTDTTTIDAIIIETSTATITEGISRNGGRPKRLNFSNKSERAAHVAAFLAWLPSDLREAPGIDWEGLPSSVMGYLLKGSADGPDIDAITIALGCAVGERSKTSYGRCVDLATLLRRLRDEYGLRDLSELGTPGVWQRFVADRELTSFESKGMNTYGFFASRRIPAWLESLDAAERARWAPRTLPRPPVGLLLRLNQYRRIESEAQENRKAQTDTLVPLFPLLVALAQLRKQALQRLVERFHAERQRAEGDEIALPHRFVLTETLRTIGEGATTLGEACFIEREVTLHFTLWDRRSWVLAHPERYCRSTITSARTRATRTSYGPGKDRHFLLQYQGPPADLFWFGDVLANDDLYEGTSSKSPFKVARSGLLQPSNHQARFFRHGRQPGELLFDPECLYRGVLYGAALAMAALTSAARVSELLQFATPRYKIELVPEFDAELRKTGNQTPCVFQYLLPKGSTHETERQLFLITPEVAHLLDEITLGLEAAHGEVPVVETVYQAKAEDLPPARCIFQWSASEDGHTGLLSEEDVLSLLRFLFHGLPLATAAGEPILIVTHLLRHLTATHARHYQRVPVEIVAHLLLHHKLVRAGRGGAGRLMAPAVTEYYSRMPMQEQLGLLYTLQERHRITPDDIVVMPEASDLDAMEAHLRRVFEQWGAIAPVTFGACGSPGLCVRPDNRNHCLGCVFLVPDWRRAANLAPHREIIGRILARAEDQGLRTEARQARENLAHLDGLAAVMRAQRVAWEDRRELPVIERVTGPVAGQGVAGE